MHPFISYHMNCGIVKPGTRRSAHAWFLKIDPVWIVGMHVCVCVRTQGY